jgi:hypothetical protein
MFRESTSCFVRMLLLSLIVSVAIIGCSDEGGYEGPKKVEATDPSKPITFTDFFPKEGSVRTLIFCEGSNFGTDISKIEVIIGGVPAPVIGSSGTRICAMVPRRSERGDVMVRIMDQSGRLQKEYTFDEKFTLNSALQVNTLLLQFFAVCRNMLINTSDHLSQPYAL